MTTRGYHGDYPEPLFEILEAAHEVGGISIQSDLARAHALYVALAASIGWLSTVDPEGYQFGGRWRLTPAGLTALYNKEHFRP